MKPSKRISPQDVSDDRVTIFLLKKERIPQKPYPTKSMPQNPNCFPNCLLIPPIPPYPLSTPSIPRTLETLFSLLSLLGPLNIAPDHIDGQRDGDEADQAEDDGDGDDGLMTGILLIRHDNVGGVLPAKGPDWRVHEETYSGWSWRESRFSKGGRQLESCVRR